MLEARSVSYTYHTKYQTVAAVKDVSAKFEAGKFYAIIGPSGSGKTTLLALLAGLGIPDTGSVTFQGRSTAELDRDALRLEHISVIYQNFNLFSHLTALENAAYPLYLRGVKKKEAESTARETLLTVGLSEDQFQRRPNMLSGGEQQRVAIARALSSGAQVLLADEPTGNLDGENSRNVVELLAELAHQKGYCVIVVTHDMAIAKASDVVYEMVDGSLRQEE